MDLLEYEGKHLLAEVGIAVPRGALWPGLPEDVSRFVVKGQVPAGRRGKQGGVRFAGTAEDATSAANAMQGSRIGGFAVSHVYIEERIDIARELYLALALDRDRRCITCLASPHGGADIEESDRTRVLAQAIDPLIGVRPFTIAQIARRLAIPEAVSELGRLIERLYRLALQEDAVLIEINPLALTGAGQLVAVDAKLVIDDAALFRHPRWSSRPALDRSTELERELRAAGAIGVEVDPDGAIIAVVSGAGLMMTALDVLTALGGSVRCVVDMQGLPLQGADGMAPLCRIVARARSRVVLIGGRFQAPVAEAFASALAQSLGAMIPARRRIGWIAGNRAADARAILAGSGFDVFDEFKRAMIMAAA